MFVDNIKVEKVDGVWLVHVDINDQTRITKVLTEAQVRNLRLQIDNDLED